jgi:uncharacterized protein (TIGR02598 family)
MRSLKPKRTKKGFTLLEVVVALAIFTFAIVSMIGLVPATIVSHRQAVSNTVLSQITQQLSAEAQMSGPAEFSSFNGKTWYFDYQGNQLTSQSSSGVVYQAKVVVSPVYLSGQTTSSNPPLQLVQIYDAFDPTPNGTILANLVNLGTPNGVIVVNQPTALAGGL